jgi:alkaline phosphatase
MAAGVVTTTRVTDATPAATYAHVAKRELETDIAAALGMAGLDVVFGGGVDYFVGGAQGGVRTDGRDLLAEMRAKGYRTPVNTAGLASLDERAAQPVIGLFARSDMSFNAVRDPAKEPSLTQMTSKAISVLARNPNGFFLMVEGGLIDLALHATNAKRALQETVAFDQALKSAIAQMQAIDPGLKNTLIVATADHDHTLLLNGYAKRTGPTTATQPGVLGLVRQVADGKPRRDLDGAPMTIIGFGTGEHRVQGSRAAKAALTDDIVTADDYHQEAVVRTAPGDETHGGTDVYLGAIGAGAERFHGTIDNTQVFHVIKAAAGW